MLITENAFIPHRSHMSSWHCLGHSIRSNPKQRWGLRHKPKTALFKELKLTSNDGPARDDDLWKDNIVDGWGQLSTDDKICQVNTSASPCTSKHLPRKQLLQFDKSHRPAFYGSWPKKRLAVVYINGSSCLSGNVFKIVW